MGKKFFCIFFVILILCFSIVRLFAVDPQSFISQQIFQSVNTEAVKFGNVVVSNYNFTFTFNGTASGGGGRNSFGNFFNVYNMTFYANHVYFVYYIPVDGLYLFCSLGSSGQSILFSVPSSLYYFPDSDTFAHFGWNSTDGFFYDNVSTKLIVFDVTDYVSEFPTAESLVSFLESINYDFSYSYPEVYYFNTSYFSPVASFYSSFLQIFSLEYTNYFGVLIFFTVCLSVFIVAFIIVSIIRRCRGF